MANVELETLVSFSEWRTFAFGLSGRLRSVASEPVPPANPATIGQVTEEGLETLLMLNLDVVFPGWLLQNNAKSLNDWSGADIAATDPSGCQHLFEVKYGAKATHVVDQVLAYALGCLRTPTPTWLADQSEEDVSLLIEARLTALWTRSRADKWERDASLPLVERIRTSARTLAEAAGLDINEICSAAASQVARLRARFDSRPTRVSSLHAHVVVPDWRKVDPANVRNLAHLRYRSVEASIWEARVTMDSGTRSGRLWVREVKLAALEPVSRSRVVPPSQGLDLGHVRAEYGALGGDGAKWEFGIAGDHLRRRVAGEEGTAAEGLELRLDNAGGLQLTLITGVPGFVAAGLSGNSQWAEQVQGRRTAVAKWGQRAIPPTTADPARIGRVGGARKWSGLLGQVPVEASRSASGKSVTVVFPGGLEPNEVAQALLEAERIADDVSAEFGAHFRPFR